jgi:hypothetical protein
MTGACTPGRSTCPDLRPAAQVGRGYREAVYLDVACVDSAVREQQDLSPRADAAQSQPTEVGGPRVVPDRNFPVRDQDGDVLESVIGGEQDPLGAEAEGAAPQRDARP